MATSHHSHDDMTLIPERLRLFRSPRGDVTASIDGDEYPNVTVRRAFPLETSTQFIGFFREDGEELGVLPDAEQLDAESRRLLYDELDNVYFRPVITNIDDIGEDFGTVGMAVQTTSGPRQIEIRQLRKNVRPLSGNRLLIEDTEGNRYELPDTHKLPKRQRDVLGL
jgi:hypothetical protein